MEIQVPTQADQIMLLVIFPEDLSLLEYLRMFVTWLQFKMTYMLRMRKQWRSNEIEEPTQAELNTYS